MEDLYSILGCTVDAAEDEIRQKYKSLARQYHPDSHRKHTKQACQLDFAKISSAYKVLIEADTRFQYNIRWHEMKLLQEMPIHDVIGVEEFDSEADSLFSYPCRCGDSFLLSQLDVTVRVPYASCSSCSLCVKITYAEDAGNSETMMLPSSPVNS